MAKKATARPTTRPLNPDEMGRLGESRFGELCDAGRMIANDSHRADKMGWDFHVEFPHPHGRTDAPFDSRAKMPDMKVQVKTIWSDRGSVDVELVAAERLAGWDFPSFIVILRLNMDTTLRDLYVVHLLGDNLAMILKALRRAEAENSLSIKNRTISFGIQHGKPIEINGAALAISLRDAIGANPDEYVLIKRGQRKFLGFEPRSYAISFSLAAHNDDEILDIFLGLRPGQAKDFKTDEIRFNIPIVKARSETATIEIKPESRGICEVVVTSSVGNRRRAIFEAEHYFASTTMDASGAWKMLIVSPYLEILCRGNSRTVEFTTRSISQLRIPVRDAIAINRTLHILALGRGTVFVRRNGSRVLSFKIDHEPSPQMQREAESRLEFLAQFGDLLRESGAEDLAMNSDDIEANMGAIQLAIRTQKTNNDVVTTLGIVPRSDSPPIPPELEGMIASQIVINDVRVAFWASMNVTSTPEDGHVALRCSKMMLRDIVRLADDETFEEFVGKAQAVTGISLVIKTESLRWSGDSVTNLMLTAE